MITLLAPLGAWLVLSVAAAMLIGHALRGRTVTVTPYADPYPTARPRPAPARPAGPDLERQRLLRVLDEGAFTPHYQPIIDLTDDVTIGVEALTRFDDGTSPQVRFHHATMIGLGLELELATLRAAIEEAARFDEGFLAVNVSPTLLAHTSLLAEVLAGARQPLVIELSEQEAVEDYDGLRGALDELPPGVRLSVDDAGSGFASLRHILQLRPDYVKMDRTWVHDVDHDPARQALIAGLRSFADSLGAVLVAEGVEVAEERESLVGLGVTYGQGWLLGRPAPLDRAAPAHAG